MRLLDPLLRRFLAYARPYHRWITGATFCGLLKFNLPVLFPLALKYVIDHLVGEPRLTTAELNLLAAALVALFVLYAVANYLRGYLAEHASQRMVFDLRRDLYAHLQRMSLGFYERRRVGAVGARLIGDINTAQGYVGAIFTNTLMDVSALAFIAAVLLWENWRLALLAFSILPFYVFINRRFNRRIKETSGRAQAQMEEISGNVHEKLAAVSVVQAYTRERAEHRRFFRDARRHLGYLLRNAHHSALATASVGFLTSVAPVVVVWYGALQVLSGGLSVGGLVAFYAYLGMFYFPLTRLSELHLQLATARSAMERVFEVLDTAPEVVERPDARTLGRARGELRFEHVRFGYDPDRPVLHDLDLDVPAGQTVALVGRSGAGKSSLIKLIPRFYDVNAGSVRFDGVDVRELRLKSLRERIALIPQEPVLFSGTVAENIRYGRPNATDAEVIAAARAADAHGFIAPLPRGYDTEIGERGVTLSGGQRQRLALARAFLKDAPVLILDEATSALDAESEGAIQHALARLMRGRTTLVIAHRLSTIQAADRIVVLDEGRVVESGTHAELLAQPDGLYRRLYQEQYRVQGTTGGEDGADDPAQPVYA